MNVNIIFTRHKELGNCNSMVLYDIMKAMKPDVIFEELSTFNFDRAYKNKTLLTLEVSAIKKYIQNYNIPHIPVDTYKFPNSYEKEKDFLLSNLVENSQLVESYKIRRLLDFQLKAIEKDGFRYLNSDANDSTLEKISTLKEKILNIINDENLFRINQLDKEVIKNRENTILDNIYNYSKQNKYENGLLFIGSGHRKSIISLVEERRMKGKLNINWEFHTP